VVVVLLVIVFVIAGLELGLLQEVTQQHAVVVSFMFIPNTILCP
jgi:hypothetical protein